MVFWLNMPSVLLVLELQGITLAKCHCCLGLSLTMVQKPQPSQYTTGYLNMGPYRLQHHLVLNCGNIFFIFSYIPYSIV